MEHSHQKRKCFNMSIKKEMQLRILRRLLVLVILFSLVSGGIFYHYSNREIEANYKQFHVQLHNMRQVLIPWIFLAISLGAFIALGLAVFYPKKIAGPLYRLERSLRDMASGDLKEPVRLRAHDELQDLAREINHLGDTLRQRLLSAKKTSLAIDTIINEDLPGNHSQDVICRLQKESAHLKTIFNEFTL